MDQTQFRDTFVTNHDVEKFDPRGFDSDDSEALIKRLEQHSKENVDKINNYNE